MTSPTSVQTTKVIDEFPPELVCDVQTLDGAIVHMRPIDPTTAHVW